MPYASIDINIGDVSRKFFYRSGTSDEGVIQQIFIQEDYALNRLRRFEDLIAYGQNQINSGLRPLIVDAGANIGASAVYFALKFPSAQGVAIEPDKDNFDLLQLNAGGLDLEPVWGGVASSAGFMDVIDVGEGSWGFRTGPVTTNASGVHAVTVNNIYQKHSQNCFPFITKIDIEGGEKDLFSQNVEWIARTPLIIIELHDWLMPKGRTSSTFLRCISQHDRDFVHIGENIFSISNNLF